jgi:mannosyltransferase
MTIVADQGVDGGSPDAATARPARLPTWAGPVAVGAIVLLGVVVRFVQRSPLWLDEALSVNIAQLPLGDLFEALRHDGHPPLYYLLLHFWMELVGESDAAVRALSGVLAVAALPLMGIAGRRLAGAGGARWAVVVAATSPYWVRYATETRMYSLVMLLVVAGYLLLTDALGRPTWPRLAGLTLISGLLLLTHYWSFYLFGAVGLVLVVRAWRRPEHRPATLRVTAAVAAGGVLFLPWLPGFLYQAAHTGTPWGDPFRPGAILGSTLTEMGGGTFSEGALYGAGVLVLTLVALLAVRSAGHELTLDVRTAPTVRRELAVVAGVLAIGTVAGYATDATYQSRYAAVVVPLVLLAVAVGIMRVPGSARLLVGAVYLALSAIGIGWVNYYQRTQSADVAAAVAARAQPGDVVVYCPDQLGPAVSREMPAGVVELPYPAIDTTPERVDWVDYAERNAAADPAAIAAEVLARADGNAVFLVWMSDYQTYGNQCETLIGELGLTESLVVQDSTRFYEPASLNWTPEAAPPPD